MRIRTARRGAPSMPVLAALLLVALAVNLAGAAGATRGLQPDDPPAAATAPLRLAAVSPWVEPDGTWTARFDVTGSFPLDATVSISVRRPLSGSEDEVRARLAQAREGDDLPSALQSEITRPMSEVLTPQSLTIDLPIRSRSGDTSRVLVPNAGVHPVVIELDAADGTALFQEVLFLNRLPAEVEGDPLQLNLLLGVHSPTTVQPDSTWTVPEAGRLAAQRAVRLLDAHPSVPVSIQPDPDLIDAFGFSHDPADQALLQRLSALLISHETLRSPWDPLDTEAWTTTGRLSDLQNTIVLAQQTLRVQTASEPVGNNWADDPTLGPGSLPFLADVGVQRLVVDPDQLAADPSLEDGPATTRSFIVENSGERLDAATLDPRIAALLASTDRPAVAVAHDVISELQAVWFAADETTPGVMIAIDERVKEENVTALLDVLGPDKTPLVEPTTLEAWFEHTSPYEQTETRRTDTVVRELAERTDVVGIAPLSTYLNALRARAKAYHSTMADTPGLVPLDLLLASSQGRDLDEPGQRARLDAAARRIDGDLSAISAPPRRNFTVTSREATLPLQFGNALDRPVKVEVRFSGARLEIEGGRSRLLELQPGLTKVDLPVVARTSGQFEIGVEMRTADGDLTISRTSIRVRSTAFSGVGLLLGGGALAFLAVWWIRTLRRSRRATEDEPEPADPDPSLV